MSSHTHSARRSEGVKFNGINVTKLNNLPKAAISASV